MGKKAIYFLSDFHLGTDGQLSSLEREKKLVRFFDAIEHDAKKIYLLGDVFDYWFEYQRAIPKGFVRILGKIANMRDSGIEIEFFIGNHDMWMFRYFEDEFNIPIHRKPLSVILQGKKFLLAHGDGLGPGDKKYKMIKKVFSNKFLQKLYGAIHPNLGLRLMRKFSSKSREYNSDEEMNFLGPEKEWLVQFSESYVEETYVDYFVFGHRHLPIAYKLSNGTSEYVNLGDWLSHYSYGKLQKGNLELLFFENENGKIYP